MFATQFYRPSLSTFSELDRLFDAAMRGVAAPRVHRVAGPALDVTRTDSGMIVRAEVPGFSKDDLEITYDDGVLTVAGKRAHTAPEGFTSLHTERGELEFRRQLRMPQGLNWDDVSARFADGLLHLEIPFSAQVGPRKIDVSAG